MIELSRPRRLLRLNRLVIGCMMALTLSSGAMAATTTLSDAPVYSTSNVPANLMLALSVEYPTGTVAAYTDNAGYSAKTTYIGYFDSAKCYDYNDHTGAGYFVPATTTSDHTCSGHWSGNMLNWALMTSLDEFRQALTGGNRVIDDPSNTVLQRSNVNAVQSNLKNFPDKVITSTGATVNGTQVPANVSPATVIGQRRFATLDTVYIRSYAQGSRFIVSNNSSFAPGGTDAFGNDNGNRAETFNAQVQVCVPGMREDNCNSQHTDYIGAGVYNKPEGLIQQNYSKIRVGASAYAFLFGWNQPNGAVRALLRDNGPTTYNGYGQPQPNPNSEWDAHTGQFKKNPDASDTSLATAPGGTAFADSGTINYLNKFGYNGNYEQFDTVGDLYWATLAYYMQVPLDSLYTNGLSQGNSTDPTFPVFTGVPFKSSHPTVNDPIQYTCQNNAIVMIGDSHTWLDSAVPGTGPATGSGSSKNLAPLPAGGNVAVPLNAADSVTQLGDLPLIEKQGSTDASKTMAQYLGVSALGTTYEIPTASATYNMAGLAYYAHVNDIRADIGGNQKVTTYVVDVLEPGAYDNSNANLSTYNPSKLSVGGGAGPNMYWLAAKYGGFNDVNGDGRPANILTWHTNNTTAAANNLRPDNYFPGNQPALIQSGLQQIFDNVASTASQTGSGLSVNATHDLRSITANTAPYFSPTPGFPAYTSQYTPVSWTGDVSGFVSTTATGAVTVADGSTPWHAQLQLDALTQATSGTGPNASIVGWKTGRRVVTWNGDANKGVPFRYGKLSASEQVAMDQVGNGNGRPLVDYLRGDKSNEGTLFRARSHILGDIVNSSAVLVQGALSTSYSESSNPGYTAFTNSVANRTPAVYVGANDGMLHALEADFLNQTGVSGGGSELFAYVPSTLFNGPNGTPLVDGLPALANLNGVSANNFAHHFYVDATPQVADVDFTYTGDGSSAPVTSTDASDWHTLLVGGLGKGGKGIYALDVTSVPQAVDTTSSESVEASQAGKVLWEFTDSDMGYSYGAPLIVKTRKYGWVVAMTSGYNNTGGKLAGHGILYILSAKTGKLLQKIDTGVGSAAQPAGLTQVTAYTQDLSDSTIDQIYGGDLLGNVWRFDLTQSALDSNGRPTDNYPAPVRLATLTDSNGKAQPVTSAPRIEQSVSASGLGVLRWVFVGTGQFLDITDLTNTQQQTMYALRDGTGPMPSTTGLPLTRDKLTADTNLLTGLSLSDSALGWYYDLTGTAGQNGGTERIVINPATAAGLNAVAWGTVIPSSDPCSLGGGVYTTNYTGKSVLLDSNGNVVPYLRTLSAVTGIQVNKNNAGNAVVSYTTSSPNSAANGSGSSSGSGLPTGGTAGTARAIGNTNNAGTSAGSFKNQVQRVNWREVMN